MVDRLRLTSCKSSPRGMVSLATQAQYFGKQSESCAAQWLSCLVPFIAFDVVASHVLPCTLLPLPSPLDVTSLYGSMDPDVVKVNFCIGSFFWVGLIMDFQTFDRMLGDWQGNVSEWVDVTIATTAPKNGLGLYDLVHHATDETIGNVAVCNILSAVLGLRHLLTVSQFCVRAVPFLTRLDGLRLSSRLRCG